MEKTEEIFDERL